MGIVDISRGGNDLDCLHHYSHAAQVQAWLWMLASWPSSTFLPMEARVQKPRMVSLPFPAPSF